MSKTLPAPAMPMGAKFDPDASLLENARNAWERDEEMKREQAERNARVLSRRVFRSDDMEFRYDVETGLTTPLFEVEGELIAYGRDRDQGMAFHLVELCAVCGKEPQFNTFGSLAGLGRVMDERDQRDAYVCRLCKFLSRDGRGKGS